MDGTPVEQVEVSSAAARRSTRRGFLVALVGAPLLVATSAALARRPSGAAARAALTPKAPLAPQAPPVGVTATGNLVRNPGFELDRMGATFTAWVLGTPLAESTEGIPPTR